MTRKRAIFTADDFGLSAAVNEAVERAHREGVLTSASLMVAGEAAEDAVRRARALPSLRVGLHLVAVEGPAELGVAEIPALVRDGTTKTVMAGHDTDIHIPASAGTGMDARIKSGRDGVSGRGHFPPNQLRLALRYAFHPAARRQLAAEIRAQFAAFAATGLALDHANSHKHMHLHPTVGRLLIDIGLEYGLRAVRIPAEPPAALAASGTLPGVGARAMHAWTALLRHQARRAGLATNDHVFGIAWSGHMTADRVLRLVPHLPDGVSELYFHPATRRDPLLTALMPDYEHQAEFAALLDSRVPGALAASGASITDFSQEADRWSR